ncbi:MAG: glycosyltransferase family 4 protein [Clostridiales bacterium]|nr:glycosyltransferase family 4 protein [Clostridiales bacterium]
MKLAIVMPPCHSMPQVTGGRVARQTELLIKDNERSSNPDEITVFSRYDERSQALASEYKHTKFVYLNVDRSEPLSNRIKSAIMGKISSAAPMRYDYLNKLKTALKRKEFDEILLEDCFEFTAPIAKLTNKQLLLHAHYPFNASRDFKYIKRAFFVSDRLRESMVTAGFPAERADTLYSAVDTDLFDADNYRDIREEKRAKYGLCDDDLLAVYVGRLIPEKGVVELIKAMAQSTYAESKLKLLIVGAAEYGEEIRDEYREQLEAEAPDDRIIFVGGVKPTSTARFLARADFAVVPSICDEPCGLSALEAMACGLPLIISASRGIAEYAVGDSDNDHCTVVKRGLGYVNSLAKAVDKTAARLHNDPEWRKSAATSQRERAVRFDSCGYYDRFKNIINDEGK